MPQEKLHFAEPEEELITRLSQKTLILKWMLDGNYVTSLDALYMFGSMRFGARIDDLLREGYPVQSEWRTDDNASRRKRYKAYYLPMEYIAAAKAEKER